MDERNGWYTWTLSFRPVRLHLFLIHSILINTLFSPEQEPPMEDIAPITYSTLHAYQLPQIHDLLERSFWNGINGENQSWFKVTISLNFIFQSAILLITRQKRLLWWRCIKRLSWASPYSVLHARLISPTLLWRRAGINLGLAGRSLCSRGFVFKEFLNTISFQNHVVSPDKFKPSQRYHSSCVCQ